MFALKKQCALPVVTRIVLGQIMHLGTGCISVRFEHSVCRGPLMTPHQFIRSKLVNYTHIRQNFMINELLKIEK